MKSLILTSLFLASASALADLAPPFACDFLLGASGNTDSTTPFAFRELSARERPIMDEGSLIPASAKCYAGTHPLWTKIGISACEQDAEGGYLFLIYGSSDRASSPEGRLTRGADIQLYVSGLHLSPKTSREFKASINAIDSEPPVRASRVAIRCKLGSRLTIEP